MLVNLMIYTCSEILLS